MRCFYCALECKTMSAYCVTIAEFVVGPRGGIGRRKGLKIP